MSTSAILGYIVTRHQDGGLQEEQFPLKGQYIDAVATVLGMLDEQRTYYEDRPSEFQSAWEYSGDEDDWQSSIDHWFREMKERTYRGERVDLSDADYIYIQEITGPLEAIESPDEDVQRQMIGYATFIVSDGNIAYNDLDVLSKKRYAIDHALNVIQSQYEDDILSNPDHPHFLKEEHRFSTDIPRDYDEMRDAACRLEKVDLDDNESLFIMEVYAYRRKWRPLRRIARFLGRFFKR